MIYIVWQWAPGLGETESSVCSDNVWMWKVIVTVWCEEVGDDRFYVQISGTPVNQMTGYAVVQKVAEWRMSVMDFVSLWHCRRLVRLGRRRVGIAVFNVFVYVLAATGNILRCSSLQMSAV